MLTQTISPIIFSIGPLEVRWYGLVYVIGFLLAYWWLRKLAREGQIRNLTEENAEQFLILLIIGVVIGGRLFEFLFYQWDVLVTTPLQVLRIWEGGMSFHGGLIGVALVTWWFTRKHGVPLLELGDALAIPAAFSLFLGRIANYINSELVGKVTDAAWCVRFPEAAAPGNNGCRHPSQLYEALKNLAIFGTLSWAWRRRAEKPGLIMWLFITLYGLLRFIVNFWRDDPVALLGISTGQALSLLMFLIGGAALAWRYHPWKSGKNY
ncbi:prolipoprotein diacylglyceryl transferase [Candidatus Woesearchaeota archaeon]|nr:prolipoprotein diacylglyceryl transferase [Candidatus Woesearchaeota archaeon]